MRHPEGPRIVIELVVLDVNETLFPLDPVGARMAEVGLEGRLELWFTRILRDGIAAAAAGRHATFRDLAEHHLLALFDGQGEQPRAGAVRHVLAGFDEVEPHPDVAPGLRTLREHGVAAVALTNGSAAVARDFLERAGLDGLVDAVHDVAEVARWKPAPDAYRGVLDQRSVLAADAAMVAVHPWDVLGAQAAGLVGAWLNRDARPYPAAFGEPDVQAPDLPAVIAALLTSPPAH